MSRPKLKLKRWPSLLVVCDGVSDPGNAGTLLRAAAGAGADGAFFLPGCTDPWSSKALRSGMGAHFRIPIVKSVTWADLVRKLSNWRCEMRFADAKGQLSYYEADWTRPSALIVGSEANGLQLDVGSLRAETVSISLEGQESLNVAVACAVILFEARRQRLLA